MLPIPRRYEAAGVRRYGFHGISYTFLMEELARTGGREVAEGRVILTALDPESGTRSSADVVVAQRVASVTVSVHDLTFDALGDTVPVSIVARDRLGAAAMSATTRTARSAKAKKCSTCAAIRAASRCTPR